MDPFSLGDVVGARCRVATSSNSQGKGGRDMSRTAVDGKTLPQTPRTRLHRARCFRLKIILSGLHPLTSLQRWNLGPYSCGVPALPSSALLRDINLGGAIVAGTEQKPSERDRPVFGRTRRDFRHCGAPSDMVRAGKSERLLRIIRESRVMMWEQYRQRGCRNGKTGRHARSVNIRGQYGDTRRSGDPRDDDRQGDGRTV